MEEAHADAALQGRCSAIETRACVAAQLAIRQNQLFGFAAAVTETIHAKFLQKSLPVLLLRTHTHLNLYVACIKGNERILKEKLRNLITCLIMEQSFLSYTIMNYYSSANDTGPVYSNQYQQTMLLADILMQSSKDHAETALL